MSDYCHYHPLSPAKWRCRQCQKEYCKTCLPDANEKKRRGNCPLCHQPLQYLGAANTAIPFWDRLPDFFRYPLTKDPLILIAICTFVPLFFTSQLIAAIVSFLLLCVMTKYLFSILELTSEGKFQPPALQEAFSGEGLNALFQQIGVFIIFILIIVGAGQTGGPVLAFIAMALMLFALPASIILLAIEKSIVSAVNPLQLTVLISTLGWPYFILYTHLLLFCLAMGVGADFFAEHANAKIAYAGTGFINSYFMMIIFHMLGYVLFQYQEKLGYATDDHTLSGSESNTAHRPDRLDADIDLFLKEGDYKRVKHLLIEAIKKNPHDPWRLEQLFRLCQAQKDLDTLIPKLEPILSMLLVRSKDQEAIKMLKQVYHENPDYQLKDPEVSFKLAQAAYHLNDYKIIVRLFKDFHKRFENFGKTPDAYVLLARSLANGMGYKDKALAYLNYLVKSYPDYDNIENIKGMARDLSEGKRI